MKDFAEALLTHATSECVTLANFETASTLDSDRCAFLPIRCEFPSMRPEETEERSIINRPMASRLSVAVLMFRLFWVTCRVVRAAAHEASAVVLLCLESGERPATRITPMSRTISAMKVHAIACW